MTEYDLPTKPGVWRRGDFWVDVFLNQFGVLRCYLFGTEGIYNVTDLLRGNWHPAGEAREDGGDGDE